MAVMRGPHMTSKERSKHRNAAKQQHREALLHEPDVSILTPEERIAIGDTSYRHFADGAVPTRQAALQLAADQVLSENRRRTIPFANVSHWLRPHWIKLDEQTGQTFATDGRFQHTEKIEKHKAPQAEPTEMIGPPAPVQAEAQTPETPPESDGVNIDTQPKEPKKPKKKVFWKPDEIEKVALETARLMVEDREGSLSDVEAIRQAQRNVLAEDRQRAISQIALAQDVHDRAITLMPVVRRRNEKQEREAREALEAEQRMAAAEEERKANEIRMAEQTAHFTEQAERAAALAKEDEFRNRAQAEAFSKAVAAEVSKQLDSATYPALIGAIAKKVMGDFMGSLSEQIHTIATEAAKTAVNEQVKLGIAQMPVREVPASVVQLAQGATVPLGTQEIKLAPKDHTPKILVVGLTYQQFDELKKGFFGMAELELIKTHSGGMNGGNAGANMLSAAKRADVVVAMVDHVGADVKAAALKCTIPFIRITGAMSGARRWIRQWLNGEISIAA